MQLTRYIRNIFPRDRIIALIVAVNSQLAAGPELITWFFFFFFFVIVVLVSVL